MRRVVLTIHGVDTRGEWQKRVAPLLSRHGFTPYLLDYGRLPHIRVLSPWSRSGLVDWLNREIMAIVDSEQIGRPSVIAHSYGTYILAQALKRYPFIKLDRVLFCGSIVDPKFDWGSLIAKGQLNSLRNEVGRKDLWAGLMKWFQLLIPDVGPSGAKGFSNADPRVADESFLDYGHSNFFEPGHAKNYWIPFLREILLSEKDQQEFKRLLDVSRISVAKSLGIVSDDLRANFMALSGDRRELYIPDGLAYPIDLFHIDRLGSGEEKELDIRIPIGMGCAGRAFEDRALTMAIFEPGWSSYPIPKEELRKAHPDLRWIISAPVPDPDDPNRCAISGILNIDCLNVVKSKDDLSVAADAVESIAKAVGGLLGSLVRGAR